MSQILTLISNLGCNVDKILNVKYFGIVIKCDNGVKFCFTFK